MDADGKQDGGGGVGVVVVVVLVVVVVCNGIVMHPMEHGNRGSSGLEIWVPHKSHKPSAVDTLQQVVPSWVEEWHLGPKWSLHTKSI